MRTCRLRALIERTARTACVEFWATFPVACACPWLGCLQLLMILQSERFPNARRLAEACEVSRRTIYRDLAILEAAGIEVLYQPERQGYQLARELLAPADSARR